MRVFGILIPIGGFAHLCYGWPGQLASQRPEDPVHPETNPAISRSPNSFGVFPVAGDPFHFIPCTRTFELPSLDDPEPRDTWAAKFDHDPANWMWGYGTSYGSQTEIDGYEGRGIHLCGYLDVPLDYTNKSDSRIARLAISKYQVSGLNHVAGTGNAQRDGKSVRTIVANPGGPSVGGVGWVQGMGEDVSKGLSDGQFDVLGFDPRGVDLSLPAISCFPRDTDRDRVEEMFQWRAASSDPKAQLELMDAMNDAIFNSCWHRLADIPRFMTTAFVARDLEHIRQALGEEEVSGAFYSYGTAIAQTYANMFPNKVGRMILDGVLYTRDERDLVGWAQGFTANSTDAFEDGFLGECINAGPDYCELATGVDGPNETLTSLLERVKNILQQVLTRPQKLYEPSRGPVLIDYKEVATALFLSMYHPRTWPSFVQDIHALESDGKLSPAMAMNFNLESESSSQCPSAKPFPQELYYMVVCGDSYEAPQQDLSWWGNLWWNMTTSSSLMGDGAFLSILPCRNFNKYWTAAEVYRGDLNNTLSNPVLLVGGTYDPATPLIKAKRLLNEMGENARLIVHHGYGHCSSSDASACTGALLKSYMLNGTLPSEQETDCYADGKPYLPSVDQAVREVQDPNYMGMVDAWQKFMTEHQPRGLRYLPL